MKDNTTQFPVITMQAIEEINQQFMDEFRVMDLDKMRKRIASVNSSMRLAAIRLEMCFSPGLSEDEQAEAFEQSMQEMVRQYGLTKQQYKEAVAALLLDRDEMLAIYEHKAFGGSE